MRFKDFLNERDDNPFGGFTNSLSTIIDRGLFLWRGLYFQDGKLLASPWVNTKDGNYQVGIYKFSARTTDRVSATGDNTILSIMSKWKDFPNRSRSYFATQGRQHIDKFGDDYGLVIPADHPNLFGYMPYDVNEPEYKSAGLTMQKKISAFRLALKDVVVDLRELYQGDNKTNLVKSIISIAEKHDAIPLLKQESFARLTTQTFDIATHLCDDLYLLLKSKNASGELKSIYTLYELIEGHGYTSIQDFIGDITPANFDASVHTLQTLPVAPELSNEIWFEGDYIAIKRYDLQDMKEEVVLEILKELRSPTPRKEIEV